MTLALPRRTECRLDFHHVTVSRGHIMAPAGPSASVRLNARLSVAVALRARPGHTESREGRSISIWKSTWPMTLTAYNEQISYAFFPWL